MAAGKIAFVPLALLCALAAPEATVGPLATEHHGAPSALVVRASVPVRVRGGHGEASLRGCVAGRLWRFAAAWSSADGQLRFGGVIVTERTP